MGFAQSFLEKTVELRTMAFSKILALWPVAFVFFMLLLLFQPTLPQPVNPLMLLHYRQLFVTIMSKMRPLVDLLHQVN